MVAASTPTYSSLINIGSEMSNSDILGFHNPDNDELMTNHLFWHIVNKLEEGPEADARVTLKNTD